VNGGIRNDKSTVEGVEATIRPEFPEAAEVGSIVVHVGAREDLDLVMGVGES